MDLSNFPENVEVIGEGEYISWCPTCGMNGHPPGDTDSNPVIYRTDDPDLAKMESRDHREWHPDHRPIARGPGGERLYG